MPGKKYVPLLLLLLAIYWIITNPLDAAASTRQLFTALGDGAHAATAFLTSLT